MDALITGGAGFIGSHVADELLRHGHRVRALDCLDPQVHAQRVRPDYLPEDVELQVGDVRDPEAVSRALEGVDWVVHLAARVGVGQSMYEIEQYTSVNSHGTAVLLNALLERPVERLVVASSMSVYGEGRYQTLAGEEAQPQPRDAAQLQAGDWDPRGADGQLLVPVATPESKPPALSSIYALNKFDQEQMCLLFGSAYGVAATALRFFNVYGPHQALSNPYTGVLAIFASRLLNHRPPLMFEDGAQRRDFVSVYDVARACRLALTAPGTAGQTINVGSGEDVSVSQVAGQLAEVLALEDIEPQVTGKYRVGDIRHCFADVSLAREALGFTPEVRLAQGMAALASWLEGQLPIDRVDAAAAELAVRGLAR